MATDPAVANTPQSHVQRAWAGLLRHAGAGLLVLTVGLAVLAWSTWQLRCESFGCTFVGVIWVVLAGLWAVVLVMALAFGAAQRRRGGAPAPLPGRWACCWRWARGTCSTGCCTELPWRA